MPKDARLPISCFLAALAAAALLAGSPTAARAEAWWAQVGWIHSDTGLVREGDGFWAAVEGRRPLGIGSLDLGYSLGYAQKVGSVYMVFSDPYAGFLIGPAVVTLHTLEAALKAGLATDVGPLRARLYGGPAIALKLAEAWDTPIGSADRDYSYEDVDLTLLVGGNLEYGAWMLDFRFDSGLTDQLLVQGVVDGGSAAKADAPEGIDPLPAAGNRVESWRLGLGYRFSGP